MKRKPYSRRKRTTAKSVLRLPDLDHAKAAVLNSLTSLDAQRGYRHAIDEFVDWYCSEPRLVLNRIVASEPSAAPRQQPAVHSTCPLPNTGSVPNKRRLRATRALDATLEALLYSYCRLLPPRPIAELLVGSEMTGAGDGNRTQRPLKSLPKQ